MKLAKKKITIAKKKTTKKKSKKIIVAKPKKKSSKKKVVVTVTKKPNEIEEADAPESIEVKGWKKKLEEKKEKLKPKILRPKSELWDKRLTEKKETGKRRKGIVIVIDGMRKAGKTNIALSSSRFEGFEGKRRIIPKGYPVYVLDTEDAVDDERDFNYHDIDDIIIENVFIEDPITKELDPLKSMDKLQEWAYSLKDEEEGTLIIDTFTDYCEWAKWKLEELKQVPHNPIGKKQARLTRYDFGWLYKRVNTFLRTLRHMKINVILIAKVKDEWINPDPSNQYSAYKTGDFLTEATKGFDYWVDVIARYTKIKTTNGVLRRVEVLDSRFETVDMKNRKYVLEGDPTIDGLVKLFKDLL